MKKRSVTLNGHRTSVSLEKEFWDALAIIAEREKRSLSSIIAKVDRRRVENSPAPGLASALRLYVLEDLKIQQQHQTPLP